MQRAARDHRAAVSLMSAWCLAQAWKRGGAEALLSKGWAIPCLLGDAQRPRVSRIVRAGPAVCGFEDQVWTVERVRALVVDEFMVRYSNSGTWRLLDRLGMSWQVPARRVAERDEQAIATWRQSTSPAVKARRAKGWVSRFPSSA